MRQCPTRAIVTQTPRRKESSHASDLFTLMSLPCRRVPTIHLPLLRSLHTSTRPAVEAAVSKATNDFEVDGRRIKRPNGQIENWVRDLSCKLI